MLILALLFLIGVSLRIALFALDDGFGGPVWTMIYWISALTWLVGFAMSIFVIYKELSL